jgi:hypothetical protein
MQDLVTTALKVESEQLEKSENRSSKNTENQAYVNTNPGGITLLPA